MLRRIKSAVVAMMDKPETEVSSQGAPTLVGVMRRLQGKIEVGSLIAIGSGRGDDAPFFDRIWPGMHALLIDLDSQFVPTWRELSRQNPKFVGVVCAAGSADGEGFFNKTNDVGGFLNSNAQEAGSTPTSVKRIDTLVKEHALPGPYFLKFDTHGVEIDVLEGCKETLKNTSLIMIEVYNFKLRFMDGKNLTFDEMSLHMKSLGFRCIDLCDPLHRPGDQVLWQFHMFFARDDHPVWKNAGYSAPALARKAT